MKSMQVQAKSYELKEVSYIPYVIAKIKMLQKDVQDGPCICKIQNTCL